MSAPQRTTQARADFELEPDEALIFRMFPTGATYQAVHLRDMWNSSLEYSNRQTSLTTDQAYLDPDGSYWMVLSAQDPGIQNWLDTEGRPEALTTLRWFWPHDDVVPQPTTRVVKFDEIPDALPADTPIFDAEARAAQLRARRQHLAWRFRS